MTIHAVRRASFALCLLTSAAHAAVAPTIVVTATRSPQSGADVLADYVSISADDIGRTNQQSLVDVLQKQRGIEVARNGGSGSASSVFIRGADGKQNVVLVDGVRIGSSTLGSANWSALPMAGIDHVEIIYGPLSTLYGADAIGGVVQVFTKKGSAAPSAHMAAGIGSDATRSLQASVSDTANAFSYALAAGKEHSDGYSSTLKGSSSYNPDSDGYDKDSASGQFGYTFAKGHEAGVLFMTSKLDAQYDSGASSYDTRSLQRQRNAAFYVKDQFTPDWRGSIELSRADDDSRTRTGDAASGKSGIETEQTGLAWQNDVMIGPDSLQLLVERRKEQVMSSTTAALNRERITDSLATSYLLKRGAHLAIGSVRNDDSSQYGSHTSYAGGYGYRIDSALRANVAYGTSFRAPTFNDLYFPGFGVASNRPERGKNAEAGLYFDNGATQLSAVYYRNRLTDLLVTTSKCPVEPAAHPSGCSYNVDQARLQGWSLAGATRVGTLSLRASADFQDPRDETTGKALNRRARRHGTLAADYAIGDASFGVEVLGSSSRFDDAANKNTLGGYGLVNLVATWKLAAGWSALARWDNAAGKRYELARNYATAGAKAFAGLRYALN